MMRTTFVGRKEIAENMKTEVGKTIVRLAIISWIIDHNQKFRITTEEKIKNTQRRVYKIIKEDT